MSAGYVIPVDPAEMASRFASSGDPRFEEDAYGLEEVSEEDVAAFLASGADDFESKISPLLDRIPEREADLIFLYFIQEKRQADIAEIFGVTQAAISYRLDRGLQRIRFLLSIPQVTEDELRSDLPKVFPQKIDVDILIGMWETTCQSEVATKLGLTQGRVRHRFFKAVETLEAAAQDDSQFEPYRKIFHAISSKKFNILREVRLPQWADRGGDECF